jgi:hypothetical protein
MTTHERSFSSSTLGSERKDKSRGARRSRTELTDQRVLPMGEGVTKRSDWQATPTGDSARRRQVAVADQCLPLTRQSRAGATATADGPGQAAPATAGAFHQPPPRAWNKAAVSA